MSHLLLTRHEEFALITLNRPERMNALTEEILTEIPQILDQLERVEPPRAVFFRGAGEKAFCAGADLGAVGQRVPTEQLARVRLAQDCMNRIAQSPLSTIALIHGHALGGGLELALACNFRLASPAAKLSLPEIKLGLVPSFGGTQRLPRLIGETAALDMIMTGRAMEAEEALKTGLISQIAPAEALLETGLIFARRFSHLSRPVLALVRRAVQQGLELPLEAGLALEAECSALSHQTEDSREGLAAFREKRKPRFMDR